MYPTSSHISLYFSYASSDSNRLKRLRRLCALICAALYSVLNPGFDFVEIFSSRVEVLIDLIIFNTSFSKNLSICSLDKKNNLDNLAYFSDITLLINLTLILLNWCCSLTSYLTVSKLNKNYIRRWSELYLLSFEIW